MNNYIKYLTNLIAKLKLSERQTNRYLVAFLAFAATFGFASLIYNFLEIFLNPNINSIVHRLLILIFSIFFITHFKINLKKTSTLRNLTYIDYLIIAFVLSLFVVHNIFAKDASTESIYKSILGLSLLKLTINSIAEEFIYRGFIQSYINQEQPNYYFKISTGNIVATILMSLTHLGFFLIMTPIFAITSILLVVLFSFAAGHLRDNTNGIFVPVLLHLTANYFHFFIQII